NHRQVDSEFLQHCHNAVRVRMVPTQADQRAALNSRLGRVWRLTPINKERKNSFGLGNCGVDHSPRQSNSVGTLPGSIFHRRILHTFPDGFISQLSQISGFHCPGNKLGAVEPINTKGPWLLRHRLLRIRPNYFQVSRWAKCDEGVSGSSTWMLAARCCFDTEDLFYFCDALIQVDCRVHKMIDSRNQGHGVVMRHGVIGADRVSRRSFVPTLTILRWYSSFPVLFVALFSIHSTTLPSSAS